MKHGILFAADFILLAQRCTPTEKNTFVLFCVFIFAFIYILPFSLFALLLLVFVGLNE